MKTTLVLIASLCFGLASSADDGTWKPIFNGKDLTGWHPVPGGKWEVVDGTILGTSPKSEKRHGLLMTDKRYKNFKARAKFKVTRVTAVSTSASRRPTAA